MAADLADLDAGEEKLAALEKQAAAARDAYDRAAARLTGLRAAAAIALKKAVMAELPALKLDRAEFLVEISTEPDNRTEAGVDQVEFWVRTNPGTRPGPMMKVASGGELSRFLLALKVALADRGSAPTLVFDEIDTGVGGAVADAIGQRLARLSVARPGALGHPRAAGRRARLHAFPDLQVRRQEKRLHRCRRDGPRRPTGGDSPACSPAPPSPRKPVPPPASCSARTQALRPPEAAGNARPSCTAPPPRHRVPPRFRSTNGRRSLSKGMACGAAGVRRCRQEVSVYDRHGRPALP